MLVSEQDNMNYCTIYKQTQPLQNKYNDLKSNIIKNN